MSKSIHSMLTAEQIDVLKEVGNICVGNSSGILSQLLGGQVDLNVPGLDILDMDQLTDYIKERGKMVYGVNAQITSQIQGSIFLLFPEKDALKIIDKFLKQFETQGASSIQLGISIIKEVAGIALFSYINTLSSLLKKLIISSIPSFLSGAVEELMQMMLREYEHWGKVCVIYTAFKEKELDIEGGYYLVLNKESTEMILDTMKRIYNEGY